MKKIYEVYLEALKLCEPYHILSSDLRVLLAFDMGFASPIDTLYYKDKEMNEEQIALFNSQVERLKNNEPVEYIINEANFLDLKLYVDRNVLIPRMETTELIANLSEKIYDYFDPRNYLVVADIGTGSGAIACSIKNMYKNWLVSASDISSPALEVAKKNAEKYSLPISFYKGDSLKPYIERNMNLDIIISNPPYIVNKKDVQPSVSFFEPASALYLDFSSSVYEKILADVNKVKKGSLLIVFEIGYDLKEYIEDLCKKYLGNYSYKLEFIKDLNDLDRFAFIFLE